MRTPVFASALVVTLAFGPEVAAQESRAQTRICLGPTNVEASVGNTSAVVS